MKPTLERMGGRKFVLSTLGVLLVPALAALHGPGEAYIALAGIVASYSAGNAVVTKASFSAAKPDV